MKNSNSSFIKTITIASILFGCYISAHSQVTSESSNVFSVIHSRKSVREFTDQQVSREYLEMIVKAGMAAPTAVNRQPWFFVIIDNKDIMIDIAAALFDDKVIEGAPCAIVVCGDMNKSISNVPEYWVQDCSAASQNILLAVEGLGLGAVWIGVYPFQDRIDSVSLVLNLPEHLIPLNIIPIGYPSGENIPKNKWKPENIGWNKFTD